MPHAYRSLEWRLPYLTAELPGVGGHIRQQPEDFVVEEVPAYAPIGKGEHTYIRVEKRGLSTFALVQQLAEELGVRRRDIGYAGLKDTWAVTRQTLSVWNVPPARAEALTLENARVLWARRHTNKLRTGHLRGNRFTLRIRDVHPEAEARAAPILEMLAARGVPNGYGEQRFGNRGDNHWTGWALVRHDRPALEARGVAHLSYRKRRFFVSAFQSALFNRYLAERMAQGTMDDLLHGDLAKKHDTGGIFTVEDVAVERPRIPAWEISATGPLYGYKMMEPKYEAAALEATLLRRYELTPDDFAPVKAPGTRRHLRYRPEDLEWRIEDEGLIVSFFAPSGSYATLLLRELMKSDGS